MPNTKSFAILRITFGLVWLIDTCFKWQPAFLNNFEGYLSSAAGAQPAAIAAWINFWIKITTPHAHLFAVLTAIIETAIALSLIFGLFTKWFIWIGLIFSLLIWSTAEAFGTPYVAGSTDIGAAVIYIFVFWALWLGRAWENYSLNKIFFKTNE